MGWNCEIQTPFHGYRFLVYKEKALVHILAVFNGKKDYMRVMRKFF